MIRLWLILGAAWTAGGPPVPPPEAQEAPDQPASPPAPAQEAPAPPPAAAPIPPPARVPLRGLVVARGTKDPLAGASVIVDATPAAETGPDGRFEALVPPGPRRLQIQQPGFEILAQVVVVEAAPDAEERVFRLMPRLTGERYETVVRAPDERAPRTTLREEELTQTPGSLGDPFRVIESLPGVSQVVWPLALYAIRGANPGNTGFFVDGLRVPTLFHFALGPSVIHPFFIEQMDFYPGGYPARFGRYVSGIVSARSATPRTDRVRGSADARLFDAGGIVAAPWNHGRGQVAVAGRFSYTGFLLSQFQERYTLNYWDYQARVDHALGPGRVTLFAFGSGDVLADDEDPGATGGDVVLRQGGGARLRFHRVQIGWNGALAGGRLEGGTVFGHDASYTSLSQLVSLPISAQTLTLSPRVAYERPLGRFVDLELGGDAEVQRFRPTSEIPGVADTQDLFRDRDAVSAGGFVAATLRTAARWAITPGVRYDAFREEGVSRLEPSPRLSVRFRPSPARPLWLKLGAGRFAQMASLPVSVPGFEGFGLQSVGLQTSLQGSLGVELAASEALTADATGFYQRVRLTDLRSTFSTDPQFADFLELRDGRSYGVEVMIRRPPHKRLHGWLAYTLSKSERLVGVNLARAPSDWDQRHILNLVAGYRFGRGFSGGARFHYNTGRPYPVFDPRAYKVDYVRLPPFYQVDLRGDKRFVFDRYVLDVYIELVNTTLTREVYDIRRDFDGTLDRKGFRIVLPSVGVHAEW